MGAINPARDNNAIDEIAFAVHFKSQLDCDEILKDLIDLKDELKDFIPNYEILHSLTVQLDVGNNPGQTSQKPSGILMYKKSKKEADRNEWTLRIEANRIVVACSEYSSWNQIYKQAKDFIVKSLGKISLSKHPIIEISYQCVDKFDSEGDTSKVTDVFNDESFFMTKHALESNNKSWHVHQGWFTGIEDIEAKALNNLNINNIIKQPTENGSLNSIGSINEFIISHSVRIQQIPDPSISDLEHISEVNGYLDKAFSFAHGSNKEAISDLLNKKMLDRIGLTND